MSAWDLVARLDAIGEKPVVRADRTWSKREVDAADRLLLRVRTAGLDGGIRFGQQYDRSAACATCGAGSLPSGRFLRTCPGWGGNTSMRPRTRGCWSSATT